MTHYMQKQLAAVPQELYRTRYPALADLDRYYAKTDGVPPENNVVARNVCVGKWLEVGWHAKPEMLHLENNLTNAVGRLASPINDNSTAKDFALEVDSAIPVLGIQKIPVEKIGLREDTLRHELQHRRAKGAL